MTTEFEEKKPNDKLKISEDENENDKEIREFTNEEALDYHIQYLKSSAKTILGSIIQNEPDPMIGIGDEEIKNKKIDKGIYLYLQNIHNKHYCNEMNYILNSINSKISYINDKNKEFLQNKKFLEREINTISQEKIDYFNEKENLDKDLEILTVNAKQNSVLCKTDRGDNSSVNISTNFINTNEIEDIEIAKKTKRLETVKKKYDKLFDYISANKKEFPIIKNKSNMLQGENMVLNEKLKQKQLIWDQIRKENEKVKTVVIKRSYSHVETENNKPNQPKKEEQTKKEINKNIKVSKIGSFLHNMLGKKKK
jgi:hypothetical protein